MEASGGPGAVMAWNYLVVGQSLKEPPPGPGAVRLKMVTHRPSTAPAEGGKKTEEVTSLLETEKG